MLDRSPLRISLSSFCLIAATASAQVDLDSLLDISNDTSKPDSTRFLAYYDLAWEGYLFSDPDTTYTMARWLQAEARRRGSNTFEARASELLAATWYVRGDMKTALLHYDTALALHKRDHNEEGYADVITNVATMRSFMGQHDTALAMYAEGLAIHERMQDSVSIANDLNALGRVYMVHGDHVRAVDHYSRSLRIHELLHNERGMSTGQANLGSLFLNQGDHVAALGYFREALRLAENLGDTHMMGKDLDLTGACLEELGDTNAALRDYQRSLELRLRMDDRHGLVNVKNRIGNLWNKQGEHRRALALFEESAAMATAEELPWGLGNALVGKGEALLAMGRTTDALRTSEVADRAAAEAEDVTLQRDASALRYRVLRALGRWQDALLAHERTEILNDSLLHEENQRAVLRNAYQYTFGKKAYADSVDHAFQVQQEAVRTEQQIVQERSRRNMALALGALFLILLLAFWQRARLLRRTNAAILDAQTKLLESERAREASEVRTRIAVDVHDQLGSDLTKLVMLSSEAKAMAVEDVGGLPGLADDIERIAGEANRSLGDIVWAIDPHHDSLAGLTERVRAHCERMLKWSRVAHTIDCRHEGPDRSLDPAIKRDIYLILREALNNAIKYAKATHIRVAFHTTPDAVHMEVEDDGVGIDEMRAHHGHGLPNMRQRAERAGGTLSITSSGGSGTCISLQLKIGG